MNIYSVVFRDEKGIERNVQVRGIGMSDALDNFIVDWCPVASIESITRIDTRQVQEAIDAVKDILS